MPIVRNKAEKIKMASMLKLRRSVLKWQSLKLQLSQLDLASLRDRKNMLLLEFLNGNGVFLLRHFLANLCFYVSVFLNSAKGMICNYYKILS